MSTLNAQNLTDGTQTRTMEQTLEAAVGATAKWGTDSFTALDASFNIASITDNGTGDTTLSFTAAFADADYICLYGSGRINASEVVGGNQSGQLVGSVRTVNMLPGSGARDSEELHFAGMGARA